MKLLYTRIMMGMKLKQFKLFEFLFCACVYDFACIT